MENTSGGKNTHVIKYYWNTYNSMKWYHDNIPDYPQDLWPYKTIING